MPEVPATQEAEDLCPGVQNQHGQHSNLDQNKGLTKNEQSDKIKEENSENQKKNPLIKHSIFCAMNVFGKEGKHNSFTLKNTL